jgi:hypothetical protein
MSTDTPVLAGTANVAPAPVVTAVQVPAPKLTSIQLIEQELQNFFKQAEVAAKNAEQAFANTHAIQGAIQGAQHLLAKLKAAEAAAVTEAKKLAGEAVSEVEQGIHAVEAEAKKL